MSDIFDSKPKKSSKSKSPDSQSSEEQIQNNGKPEGPENEILAPFSPTPPSPEDMFTDEPEVLDLPSEVGADYANEADLEDMDKEELVDYAHKNKIPIDETRGWDKIYRTIKAYEDS